MRDAGRRPIGRLLYWALILVAGFGLSAFGVPVPPQGGVASTTVSDTVYLADGTPASGTLILTWPAFVTSSGAAVAAGSTSVKLGANGALSIALAPNAGATPAGVYYTAVYQLGPGQVKTEYWIVPTASPANLATVRTTPGSGLAAQPVSMQYVNSLLATKADETSVVHLNGSETISGTKTFASAPNVPAPAGTGQVANKAYVDQAVANVGAGSYLSTAGGTMTGPLLLPGNPSAPLQAAPKQYVDVGFSGKADLIAGLVPASELGAGTATSGSCLLGNGTSAGTWGACGGGGGSGNVSTTPAASQNVVQPAGTQFSTNNLANARYVTTSWNWVQTPSDNLGTAGNNTIHLSPCPLGLDMTNNVNAQYMVYIAGTGTAEAAPVTGGSCAPGSGAGTITVTTAYTHTAGYTLGSASSGIQEAINDSGTQRGTIYLLPSSSSNPNYKIYAPVFLNSRSTLLSGYGALVQCFTRAACIIDGNYLGLNGQYNTIAGIEFMPGLNVDGVQIASMSASSGTYTITTATNHPFVVGDYVILFYSGSTQTQEGRFKVTSVPAANQFTYSLGNTTLASTPTYGWAAIENTAVEDISNHVTMRDIKLTPGTNQFFHWGIVVGNDQSFKLDGLTSEGTGTIRCTPNFCGAMVYARGDQGAAPVVSIEHLEASMQCSGNGIRYASGNSLHVDNSVIQGFNQYGVYYAGGYQAVKIGGMYQESGACANKSYPSNSCSSGTGCVSNVGIITNRDVTILGDDPIGGAFPNFKADNPGAQETNYFVVGHSSNTGVLGMFPVGTCSSTGTGNCTGYFPLPNLDGLGTVTWDVLATQGSTTTPPNGTGNYLVSGGLGISGNCSTSGICTFVDPQTSYASYSVPTTQRDPQFNFWPGGIVLGASASVKMFECGQGASIVTSSYLPKVICDKGVYVTSPMHSPYWASYKEGDSVGNNNGSVGAYLKQAGTVSGLAGMMGFLAPSSTMAQGDVITLAYTKPFLALATPGYRPAAIANDTAIGADNAPGAGTTSAQLAFRAPVAISEYIGSVFDNSSYKERLTGTAKTFNVPVTINGNLTVTGTCTGCGGSGGGGSGTVNSGNANQVAMYSANGTAVSGDSALTDSGTTLNYSGSGGISASSGTFNGNLSVGGQLIVTGPWLVNSPIPTTGMGAATSGTSSLGISNDGNFYISANAGTPSQVQTAATVGTTLAGYVPNTTTVNGHALTGNVTLSATEITVGTLPHAQLPALVSGDIPNNAANTTGAAASLSAASVLPNGTTATTQSPGDNSTKVATTAFVMQNQGGTVTQWIPFPGYNSINQAAFPTGASTAAVFGFTLPVTVTTSKVLYRVGSTADNTANTYEIGIYNGSGALVAHFQAAGTTFCPSTGSTKSQSWAEGAVTLPPGKYYEAIVSSCTASCATFTTGNGTVTTFYSNSGFTQNVTSGTLGSSITAPGTGNESFGASPLSIILE